MQDQPWPRRQSGAQLSKSRWCRRRARPYRHWRRLDAIRGDLMRRSNARGVLGDDFRRRQGWRAQPADPARRSRNACRPAGSDNVHPSRSHNGWRSAPDRGRFPCGHSKPAAGQTDHTPGRCQRRCRRRGCSARCGCRENEGAGKPAAEETMRSSRPTLSHFLPIATATGPPQGDETGIRVRRPVAERLAQLRDGTSMMLSRSQLPRMRIASGSCGSGAALYS